MDLSDRADFGLDVLCAMLVWCDVLAARKFHVNKSPDLVAVGPVTRTIVVPQRVVSSVTSNSRTAVAPLCLVIGLHRPA